MEESTLPALPPSLHQEKTASVTEAKSNAGETSKGHVFTRNRNGKEEMITVAVSWERSLMGGKVGREGNFRAEICTVAEDRGEKIVTIMEK